MASTFRCQSISTYHSPGEHFFVGDEFLRDHILQVPLEAMAIEAFANCLSFGDVADVHVLEFLTEIIVEPFVVVQPNFRQSGRIQAVRVAAALQTNFLNIMYNNSSKF